MPKIKANNGRQFEDHALYNHQRNDRPKTLYDYHHVVPLPRGVLPSRVIAFCKENCEEGWVIHWPAKGIATYKNTVIVFQSESDLTTFRDAYCFDAKHHKQPHEADWEASVLGDDDDAAS